MLEILVIAIVGLALLPMAKHGRRRRSMGRYIRGNVDQQVDAASLAATDVVGAAFVGVVDGRTLATSAVLTWTIQNWTDQNGSGPLICGLAHNSYTDAEIEEWIESTGQWNIGSLVAQEINKRKIRQVGAFASPDAPSDLLVLNDGKAIKTKLNWMLEEGQTLRMWVFNSGTLAVAGATDPRIRVTGHINLFPK